MASLSTNYRLFDWHCDTASAMLNQDQPLGYNSLAVSLENARKFRQYAQVMACFTSPKLSDHEGWERLQLMHQNLLQDPAIRSGEAVVYTFCPPKDHTTALLLALEDARILENDLSRVEDLYRMGFRIMTPLWSGVTCMGGSHNTSAGLSDFGKEAISLAVQKGMLPDISHASDASAEEILLIAEQHGRPVIASHSNARAICPVSRNLTKQQIHSILRLGGVIGLNLYTAFLSDQHKATKEDVLRHVEYFLEQGAEHALCLGCDMDGAALPEDIPNLAALPDLADFLLQYYSGQTVQNIFYQNAYQFAERALPPSAEKR